MGRVFFAFQIEISVLKQISEFQVHLNQSAMTSKSAYSNIFKNLVFTISILFIEKKKKKKSYKMQFTA